MSISIVTPAYNAEKHLQETIESVQSQTLRDWEILLVDDGSRDRTAEIASRYAAEDSRIRVIRQPNGGVSSARNHGREIADARRPYIIFLDSDDVWKPNALSLLHSAMERSPQAVAAHGMADYIDENSRPINLPDMEAWFASRRYVDGNRIRTRKPDATTSFNDLAVRNYVCAPSSILIRKALLSEVGSFDPSFSGCADWDMWLRLAAHGDFVCEQEIVLSYRRHPNSMSGDQQAMRREDRRVRQKFIASQDLNAEQRHAVLIAFRDQEWTLARDKARTIHESLLHGRFKDAAGQSKYLCGHLGRYLMPGH